MTGAGGAGLAALRAQAVLYLSRTYPERLGAALAELPPDDLWWQPHGRCLAFGTILVHLEGNVRQWILCGLGGAEDRRRRTEEFTLRGERPESGAELLERLGSTCSEAGRVIESLPDERLGEAIRIQGFDTTLVGAILHVVEHFSWHTGQAVWIAKARAGEGHGLAFYDDAALEREPGQGA